MNGEADERPGVPDLHLEPVAANVSLNVARTTATLNPTGQLAPNTVYRVSLVGGPTAIRANSGGTPLVNRSWSFTTAP